MAYSTDFTNQIVSTNFATKGGPFGTGNDGSSHILPTASKTASFDPSLPLCFTPITSSTNGEYQIVVGSHTGSITTGPNGRVLFIAHPKMFNLSTGVIDSNEEYFLHNLLQLMMSRIAK